MITRGIRVGVAVLFAGVLAAACGTPPHEEASPEGVTTVAPATAASGASAGEQPVLGKPERPEAKGLGEARPKLIDMGGGATAIVEGVTWKDWGGATATGSGTAGWVAPGAPLASADQEQATVVASDLGDCDGHPAYREVGWFFPQHGERDAGSHTLPVC